jgi:hypothetical protein
MLLGAFTAGVAFVAHFVWVIGFSPLVEALRARAGARSTANGSFSALGAGYVESFGMLLAFAGAVAVASTLVVRRRPPAWIIALLIAVVLPLSENLLLAQHATQYHFDRLKALVPLAAGSAVLIAMMPPRFQQRALFSWLAALTWNATHMTRSRDISVVPSLATNEPLLKRVHSAARPCALYATNAVPRGWVERTIGGNVYELVPSVDSLERLVAARGACQGVYFVKAREPGETMYVWRRAVMYDSATGAVDTLDWSASKRFTQ